MITREQFVGRVEAYLERTGSKHFEFGREVLGDPSFVRDLRNGRTPRLDTILKVLAFLDEKDAAISGAAQ